MHEETPFPREVGNVSSYVMVKNSEKAYTISFKSYFGLIMCIN